MGVDFNKILHPAEFISKPKDNANVTALMNNDIVNQFNQNFPG
jgi:hypothetical protein